nr:unnamed protein product [Trichobilharzia regenti]
MAYNMVGSAVSCWLITSFVSFSLLWTTFQWYLDSESNRCVLTQMLEIPEFQEIYVDCQRKCYSNYRLYRYQEGSRFRPGQSNVPVLFVTGSQGSFKTIRSLATTIYNFVPDNSPLDYYSVDLNEEQSALNGEIVERQTDFVNQVIDTITLMYFKKATSPKQVILIGHSVGAVVIFNLLSSRWNLNQTKVKLVISLAGPIRQPVILPDRFMAQIYHRMHNYFHQISQIPDYPLVIISITGGSRDRLVPDVLGNIDQDYPGLNSLSLTSSAVQHVWASCDHRCILWCLQLMQALDKCLLEHKFMPNDPTLRLNAFSNLLITKPLITDADLNNDVGVNNLEALRSKTSYLIPSHMSWLDKTNQRNTIMRFNLPYNGLLVKLGPFFEDPQQSVLLLVSNAPYNWLHLCIETNSGNEKHCDFITQITSKYITWIPDPLTGNSIAAGLITLSILESLQLVNSSLVYKAKFYLVVSSSPDPFWNSMTIYVDTFSKTSERIHFDLPKYSTLWSFLSPNLLTNLTPRTSGSFHRFYLPHTKYYLSASTITPILIIKRHSCTADEKFMGMITMNALWCNYFHYVAIEDTKTEISLQLPVSHLSLVNYTKESRSFIDLYLDPNCAYELSIHYSLINWYSQLFRLHCTHFGGLLCGHLLLSMILLTMRLIKINDDNYSDYPRRSLRVNEVYCHLAVIIIHFISFQLFYLPFSEWIELQQSGQLGLRLVNTLQTPAAVVHFPYIELILAHLPFLIISIPWAFLIPVGNYLLDGFFLFLSQMINRNYSEKRNDKTVSSSPTLLMIMTMLCILLIGWIICESLAVLLLSLLLLINNCSFCRQNHINSEAVKFFSSCHFMNVQGNIVCTDEEKQKSASHHANTDHSYSNIKKLKGTPSSVEFKRKNYAILFYLLKWRTFILLVLISLLMLDDWISFVVRIKESYFSLSGVLYSYTLMMHSSRLIPSTLILLCTSIWLLQFDLVRVHSSSSTSPSFRWSLSSSLVCIRKKNTAVDTITNDSNNNNNGNNSNNSNINNDNNVKQIYYFFIFSCKIIAVCLLFSIFNLAISLYRIVQLTVLSLECIALILWFSYRSYHPSSSSCEYVHKVKKMC